VKRKEKNKKDSKSSDCSRKYEIEVVELIIKVVRFITKFNQSTKLQKLE